MTVNEKRVTTTTVILTVIVVVCLAVIGFLAVKIYQLERSRVTFAPGESLPELELLNLDNSPMDSDALSQGVAVLFCFKTPCSACNTNLKVWNNIAKFFRNRIKVLGIIPDGDPAASQLVEDEIVYFPLYVPVDKKELRKMLNLRLNIAQTILIHNNRVMTIKFGDLSAEDLNELRDDIKKIITKP